MGKKLSLMGQEWNNKLKPITEYQKEYHRKKSAKFIFVFDKDSKASFCQRCETNFVFENKTKHNEIIKCPCCGKTMKVIHTWRRNDYPYVNEFMAIPKVLDNHTLVIRFIKASNSSNTPLIKVKECARMYIDELRSQPEYWCYVTKEYLSNEMIWKKHKCPYFNQSVGMYIPNRNYVGNAYEYPRNFFKEINKLDCFKYYPCENVYSFRREVTQLHYLVRSAKLNEKLSKIPNLGIERINDEHIHYYWNHSDRTFPINRNRNDLVGMLNLDKPRYKMLLECTFDFGLVKFLQDHPDIKREDFILADMDKTKYMDYLTTSMQLGVTYKKFANYANTFTGTDGRPSLWEYKHYLSTIRNLNYDMRDTYYSMPKDFRKAEEKVVSEDELRRREERRKADEARLAKAAEKDEFISKISHGLMELPEIKELCGESNGLLVYVPENAKDLFIEGRNQHNCVSTYVERIAEQKTLVFFIRQLNNPTASFVTMEMSYEGEVRQVRYKHNENCTDEKVISFVDKLSSIVKKHSKELKKVLAA